MLQRFSGSSLGYVGAPSRHLPLPAGVLTAEELPEPARPAQVDLDRIWAERRAQFLSENHISLLVRVAPSRREELLNTARAVRAEESETDGWVRLAVTFEDLRHAV